MKTNIFKRGLSMLMTVLMVLSCWVWFEPVESANAATLTGDSNYLFAYFTGTSIEGQTIHLAVSQDGLHYEPLRNNDPVIIPSKGTGCVRDPYLWYNENDGYYYILATDLDFTDTGSDYSDNSESFIVWRSKDLVNWFDETMIDVKAILGRLGVNNNNMQAVWAPQVLWDGSSFVVYFSLQCDATSNGSWNPLTIVYLKTTDLLDESKYGNYGVIHNPGRHVIDADIIKKPGTNQYYMFYKDESASGGVQAIYYMVSDNGPTGPYYAPGDANGGRGPRLFSDINKNLEGCNSFFDDNGNLITFVDEYDYVDAASNQKQAHFHVSRSSDFSTFTTLPDSSHNINTLSPRHGSVVKITDEEYKRLNDYAGEIKSSSFPENEDLTSHLVGRYFTTSDYTYNAANGKNDLKVTDGTISATTDASGNYYANFNAAGAEINLADLISGDLNIKDGFTITFSASAPSTLGSNARFFDISNNWSQRTNPDEVYLHMSPVADSNGLYVGAYNGPVTTQSWTWASQGKNYNDGVMHEYIISFADGNMILYIDGKLAMKRDRFNMNAEYGDNFLADNWYKAIGNSTMRIGKSEWADPLFTGAMQNLCIYDCALSYYDVQKMQDKFDEQAGKSTRSRIVVPETVYLTPSTGVSKTGQYYVNNSLHENSYNVSLDANRDTSKGKLQLYIPGAKDFKFNVKLTNHTDGVNIIANSKSVENTLMSVLEAAPVNGYFTFDQLDINLTDGISAGTSVVAEWEFTITMEDNTTLTHYAYTTLYAPYLNPVGSAILLEGRYYYKDELFASSMAWVSGVHGITNDPAANAYARTDTMVPLINNGAIGTGDNEDNPDTHWIRTSAASDTLSTASFRYNKVTGQNSKLGTIGVYRSPVANLIIDTSRYNNLNQIPNLTIGFNFTDKEGAGQTSWYVGDYTSGDMKYMTDYSKIDSRNNVNDVAANYYDKTGTLLDGGNYATSDVNTGAEFVEQWNRPVSTSGTSNTYIFKTGAYSYRKSGTYQGVAYSVNYVQVNGTNVDKKDLRSLVLKATYLNESDYTEASWGNFQTALQAAAEALGNPADSNITADKNELQSKMNALQTIVTLNANGGTINDSATTTVNATVGTETTVAYDLSAYEPEREGYVFNGWALTDDEEIGSTTVVSGLKPTFFATWKFDRINITFDNLIDFDKWDMSAVNGAVYDITDTGLTVTTKTGFGESYTYSDFFTVTPGKSYKVDVDVIGSGWDIYIFFCDANGNWVDFVDNLNRYSSNGSGNTSRVFTAPNKDSVVKAQIRLDSNGSGNSVKFNNIRVYEDIGISVSPVNKYVEYSSAYGELPTPERYGYDFTGWYNDKGTKVDASNVMNVTTTVNLTSKWKLNNDALTDDIVVVDFGMPVSINPLDNDTILKNAVSDYSITAVSGGEFGTFAVSNNVVTYTPNKFASKADTATYTVSYNNGKDTLTGNIRVFPASVIYYEDDCGDVKYTGNWQVVKDETPFATVSGANEVADVYGYSAEYNNTSYFSMGEAHYVTVSAADSSAWPTATFTFAGTGFDIVSLVNSSTGFVKINVTGKSGSKFNWVLDTNGSYVYENGEWVESDEAPDHYQIPVLSRDLGAYDTYTVVITPMYTKALDHTHKGSYDFCLDAIRIYNPMGDDADAATVYAADGEYIISHETIRDILVDAKDLNGKNDIATGVVYIAEGRNTSDWVEYSKAGPKNEVYLAEGQSIAFNLTVGGIKPTSVQISAHALDGTASMVFGSGSSNSNTVSISHKTSLYYNSPFVGDGYWEFDDENGCWTTTNPIVITNNGEGLLALCNIKVTTNGASAVPVSYRMTPADFAVAAATAENLAGLEPGAEALFVPDELTPETNTDVVEKGEEVLVTINTSAEVYALTVNGENAVLASVNDDGSKTWTYSFLTETRGEMTFNLVAYNSDGFASEETSVTVDVQSRIEIFFTKVTNFFKMIIEFLDNMFAN